MLSVTPPSMKATANNRFALFFHADTILLSADCAVGFANHSHQTTSAATLLSCSCLDSKFLHVGCHRLPLQFCSPESTSQVVSHRFRCSSAFLLSYRNHTTASMQPAQLTDTAAVVSFVLLAADCAVGLLTIIIHRFCGNSALLQTPYHGKHGAHSDHRRSYEHCKHLAHYHAVCSEPEPAKPGEEAEAAW
ncbi:hypothetical protein UY3_13036 [Chelonia mydas]|uniref:Uncharacterized protein n=1 Tax=Chelonia mydas TaxID=8469 RepID=M7BNV5_CHEMY|nr:hypothetical protein UY3_13036 [Chelonia mydas]